MSLVYRTMVEIEEKRTIENAVGTATQMVYSLNTERTHSCECAVQKKCLGKCSNAPNGKKPVEVFHGPN